MDGRESATTAPEGAQARVITVVVPERLRGRYTVYAQLPTRGAEAVLLRASPLDTPGVQCILKLYHPGYAPDPAILQQVQQLTAPHIVRVLEQGTDPHSGQAYEVQEFAAQGNLGEALLRSGTPQPDRVVYTVLEQLVGGLEALHALNLIHRDLKPDNVLVRSLEPLDLALTDFGQSRISEMSRITAFAGTLKYADPEAALGRTLSGDSDLWALGVMLLELLTGRHPFAGLEEAFIYNLLSQRVPIRVEGVSARWQGLLEALLQKRRDRRLDLAGVRGWMAAHRLSGTGVLEQVAPWRAPRQEDGEFSSPFLLGGQQHWGCKTLAASVSLHPEEARKALGRGRLQEFIHAQAAEQEDERLHTLSRTLERLDTRADTLDPALLNLHLVRALDPDVPPRFHGHALDASGMTDLLGFLLTQPPGTRPELATLFQEMAVLQALFPDVDGARLESRERTLHEGIPHLGAYMDPAWLADWIARPGHRLWLRAALFADQFAPHLLETALGREAPLTGEFTLELRPGSGDRVARLMVLRALSQRARGGGLVQNILVTSRRKFGQVRLQGLSSDGRFVLALLGDRVAAWSTASGKKVGGLEDKFEGVRQAHFVGGSSTVEIVMGGGPGAGEVVRHFSLEENRIVAAPDKHRLQIESHYITHVHNAHRDPSITRLYAEAQDMSRTWVFDQRNLSFININLKKVKEANSEHLRDGLFVSSCRKMVISEATQIFFEYNESNPQISLIILHNLLLSGYFIDQGRTMETRCDFIEIGRNYNHSPISFKRRWIKEIMWDLEVVLPLALFKRIKDAMANSGVAFMKIPAFTGYTDFIEQYKSYDEGTDDIDLVFLSNLLEKSLEKIQGNVYSIHDQYRENGFKTSVAALDFASMPGEVFDVAGKVPHHIYDSFFYYVSQGFLLTVDLQNCRQMDPIPLPQGEIFHSLTGFRNQYLILGAASQVWRVNLVHQRLDLLTETQGLHLMEVAFSKDGTKFALTTSNSQLLAYSYTSSLAEVEGTIAALHLMSHLHNFRAMVALGDLLSSNHHYRVHLSEAVQWYTLADPTTSIADNPDLRNLFESGTWTPDRDAFSFLLERLLARAVDGDRAALQGLALRWARGEWQPRNEQDFIHLCLPMAHAGSRQAQVLVASLLEVGEHVPRNPVSAQHWYHLAAKQGDTLAARAAQRLADQEHLDKRAVERGLQEEEYRKQLIHRHSQAQPGSSQSQRCESILTVYAYSRALGILEDKPGRDSSVAISPGLLSSYAVACVALNKLAERGDIHPEQFKSDLLNTPRVTGDQINDAIAELVRLNSDGDPNNDKRLIRHFDSSLTSLLASGYRNNEQKKFNDIALGRYYTAIYEAFADDSITPLTHPIAFTTVLHIYAYAHVRKFLAAIEGQGGAFEWDRVQRAITLTCLLMNKIALLGKDSPVQLDLPFLLRFVETEAGRDCIREVIEQQKPINFLVKSFIEDDFFSGLDFITIVVQSNDSAGDLIKNKLETYYLEVLDACKQDRLPISAYAELALPKFRSSLEALFRTVDGDPNRKENLNSTHRGAKLPAEGMLIKEQMDSEAFQDNQIILSDAGTAAKRDVSARQDGRDLQARGQSIPDGSVADTMDPDTQTTSSPKVTPVIPVGFLTLEALQRRATSGEVEAIIELGQRHELGSGVPRDLKAALRHYEQAVQLGADPGQHLNPLRKKMRWWWPF